MTTALIFLSNLLIIAAAYYLGRIRGKSIGRRDGYVQGHEHALEVYSRAIDERVLALADRVTTELGGHYSPTLHRFLVAFTRGDHLHGAEPKESAES